MRGNLPSDIEIVLVGLTEEQVEELPLGIVGIKRTYNVQEMAELYSAATIFVNPTYSDTLPTVNIEAQACGTPVITYRTGGCPETIEDGKTGVVVMRGDKCCMKNMILEVLNTWDFENVAKYCRERAITLYDKKDNFKEYLELYSEMLNK